MYVKISLKLFCIQWNCLGTFHYYLYTKTGYGTSAKFGCCITSKMYNMCTKKGVHGILTYYYLSDL